MAEKISILNGRECRISLGPKYYPDPEDNFLAQVILGITFLAREPKDKKLLPATYKLLGI